jgi:hypothetical protein
MKNEMFESMGQPSRRDFLRIGAATALGVGITKLNAESLGGDGPEPHAASVIDMPFAAVNPRIGLIGTGGRGTNLLENLLPEPTPYWRLATSFVKRPSMHNRWW